MIAQIVIHPDLEKQKQQALELIQKVELSLNHPDLLWLEEEKLGIEQARKVKDFLSLKPYQGNKQAVVILHAESLTPESQNALLKILEEPPEHSLIILGTTSEDQILATIISRCQVVNLEDLTTEESHTQYQDKIEKLRQSSIEERFKFIEKLEEKERFLHALTAYFRHQFVLTPLRWEHKLFLQDLIQAEKLAKQNVNIRAILEYLMLKLPSAKITTF